jgi:hypothetical protein
MRGQVRYDVNPLDPLDPESDKMTAARWRAWYEREEAIEAAARSRDLKTTAETSFRPPPPPQDGR